MKILSLGSSSLLMTLMLFCCGCSTMDLNSIPKFAKFEKKPEFETPLQVIPVWSNTVLHQSGKHGTRGFGGRVIFYGENKEKAVRVDGTLVVYAWDDSEEAANRQADRKYVFKVEKLQEHYSNSKIGHSYNFWLPWDAAGGEQERISLIIRFIGANGAEVNSEPTNVILPGPIKKPETMLAKQKKRANENTVEDRRILPATHETYSTESPVQQTELIRYREQQPSYQTHSLQTAEIPLTNGFIERNMQGNGIGFSSEDLFAPESTNREPSRFNSVESQQQQHGTTHQQQPVIQEKAEEVTRSSIRSRPFQSRVQTARAAPQFRGHVRKKPLPARSLNALPQTPRFESRVAQ